MNFLTLLLGMFLGCAKPVDSPPMNMAVDPCQLQGAVYVETVESFATYKVFVDDVEAFADLRVYKEGVRAFADKPGRWHFTDNKAFADFSVAFIPVKSFADFSIFYTEFQSLSGCK